jgi:ferredoxin
MKDSKTLLGAARNATASVLSGCTLCGKCLTGCPEKIIFSTDYRFLEFIRSGKIDYIRGKVLSYQDEAQSVIVNYVPVDTGNVSQISSDKLLVGAGSIASSIIYLRSNKDVDSAELSDTQVFYLPLFSWRHRGLANNSYALAQMFVTTQEQKSSGNDFFMSIYESDSSWPDRAKSISPLLAKIVPSSVYTRLLAGIGLLSSKDSGKIVLTREKSLLNIELKRSTFRTGVKVVVACLRLSPRMIRLGLLPLPFLVKVPPVGSSYHVGYLNFQGRPLLDSEGRTHHDSNVHFIDGTSLPMLPTGPVTLTVMANAMRIVKNISS